MIPLSTIIIIAILVAGTIVILSLLGSLYRKVGPNRALIVYGRGGTKVVVGGGTVVLPLFQRADEFNLELISFDVAPNYDLYTGQGIPVRIEAITQLKVENEDEKIKRAANQFLSKTQDARDTMVRQVMEGHLRGIVGQLTVEQLVKEPDMVSERMRDTVAADLDKLGIEVVSFTLKDVSDESGYIANMSRPEIARNKQVAEIAEAEVMRNVSIRQAETRREASEAQAKADQARVLAQTVSDAAQAEAQRDLQIRQAQYAQDVAKQKAQADVAYDIEKTIAEQRLVAEKAQVEVIQRQQAIKVQQAEAERRAAELVATVQRQAEAESERTRILAEAARRKAEIDAAAKAQVERVEAEGRAAAVQTQAEAEAKAIRARGLARAEADSRTIRETGNAEAETIRAKGLAEAEALEKRTNVLNEQAEPAILTAALQVLPEIAARFADAYGKVGSVTYVGSGDGEGVTNRITRDLVGMMPAVNGMLQSVTGINLGTVLGERLGQNGHRDKEPAPDTLVVDPGIMTATTPSTSNGSGDVRQQGS